MDYITLRFFNTSNYDIILTEINGMLGDNFNDYLYIKAGEVVSAKVFTSSPEFHAVYFDTKMPADNSFTYSF